MEVRSGYKYTDVGIIPDSWIESELSMLCRVPITYGIVQCGPHIPDGIPYIRVSDMKGRDLDIGEMLRTSQEIAVKFPRSTVEDGDIVYALRGKLGEVRRVRGTVVGSNLTQGTARISPKESISSEYLFWALRNPKSLLQAEMESKGTTFREITLSDLRKIKIAVPTQLEQQAIAEALSDADVYIECLEKLIAKKRLIKQGAMQELLTGKRRLPGFSKQDSYSSTEVGIIPSDWKLASIGEISKVGRGRVISHREIEKSLSPIYPVYSSQTSNQGIMGYLDTYEFEGEYITWTTDGANAGTVFARSGRFNCTNVCGTIKLERDNHHFVAMILGSVTPKHVSRHLGNPKLMNDVVKRIKIPLPGELKEQEAIAKVIKDIDTEISELTAKLEKSRLIKQGMMQELLTGRIRLV